VVPIFGFLKEIAYSLVQRYFMRGLSLGGKSRSQQGLLFRIQKENWAQPRIFKIEIWKENAIHSLYFQPFLEIRLPNYL